MVPVAEWKLVGDAGDIRQSIQPGAEVVIPVVPVQPASPGGCSAPHGLSETERSQRSLAPWRGSPHELPNMLAIAVVNCQKPLSFSRWQRGMINEVVESVVRRGFVGLTTRSYEM